MMLTGTGATAKALERAIQLFGKNYVASMMGTANFTVSISDPKDEEILVFLGFNSEKGRWSEFEYVSVNIESGGVTNLDYRLQSGLRMAKPLIPVRTALN